MTALSDLERARADPGLVVLEGFHAVKHALRFGAELTVIAAADLDRTAAMAAELAPDVVDVLKRRAQTVSGAELRRAAPHIRTGVIAVARRPWVDADAVLAGGGKAPVVVL